MDGEIVGLYQIGKGVKERLVLLSIQLVNGLEMLMIKVICCFVCDCFYQLTFSIEYSFATSKLVLLIFQVTYYKEFMELIL